MIRNIAAVFVGLIVGMIANMAIIQLDVMLYPMPDGVTFEDTEGVATYISTLPLTALLLVMLAHLGQAFAGGWVAAFISTRRCMLVAMIVGGLSMLGGITNMFMMPLPPWMWIEVPLYLVAAWAAATLELKRRGTHAS
jgi:hypothetical protein